LVLFSTVVSLLLFLNFICSPVKFVEYFNSLALGSRRTVGTCDKLSSQGIFSSLRNLREPLRPLIFFSFKRAVAGRRRRPMSCVPPHFLPLLGLVETTFISEASRERRHLLFVRCGCTPLSNLGDLREPHSNKGTPTSTFRFLLFSCSV